MEKVIANILILADGGPSIGGGHISRCRALAASLEEGGFSVRFCIPEAAGGDFPDFGSPAFYSELHRPGQFDGVDMVIADSYRFSPSILEGIRHYTKLMIVDDFRHLPVDRHADFILNYNVDSDSIPYGDKVVKLLGPKYCLLRRSFRELLPKDDGFVLFVAGSSDIGVATLDMARWYDVSWPPMVAVLGPMVPDDYFDKVSRMADKKDGLTLMRAPSDFDGLMARASSVVCTSSVTCYEAMALGKPVVVFQVAENQRRIGRALSELGWGIDLGWWKDVSPEILHGAIEKAFPPPAGCVSTDGAKRVARAILSMVR
ncbi:hypothetical protein L2W58_11940 [Dethiosulfovibrio sp. F2B]|nr:hypothetical protein [Dethiosulfovibrio faecalis]